MIAHKIKKVGNGFEVYVWNGISYYYIGTCGTKEEAEKLVEDADKKSSTLLRCKNLSDVKF